jgi:hypothetical protein
VHDFRLAILALGELTGFFLHFLDFAFYVALLETVTSSRAT